MTEQTDDHISITCPECGDTIAVQTNFSYGVLFGCSCGETGIVINENEDTSILFSPPQDEYGTYFEFPTPVPCKKCGSEGSRRYFKGRFHYTQLYCPKCSVLEREMLDSLKGKARKRLRFG